jgi:membrane protease YdiL (CAAX protease family)
MTTYALLMLSVIALWIPDPWPAWRWRPQVASALFVAALGCALAAGIVGWKGTIAATAMLAACYAFPRLPRGTLLRWTCGAAVFVLSALLMAHALDGFANVKILSDVRFSADALPYTQYLNFDKALIGLFILGFCHDRLLGARAWKTALADAAPRALGVLVILTALAWLAGYVRFDPKLPPQFPLWAAVNLLFTCVPEEAFFRGFVQHRLQAGAGAGMGRVALVAAALLFGLAHFAGGPLYVVLATVAGLGYGWVYARTNSIEASILTHFAVNATHLLLFTYPALAAALPASGR